MNFWLQLLGLVVFAYLVLVQVVKRLSRIFLPQLLNAIMKKFHTKIQVIKKSLFEEAFAKVNTKNKSGKLEILEIGIGTGENFRCLPLNSNITVLDKTDIFLPYLKQSIENHRKDLTVSDLVVCSADDMNKIESNSMDAVIYTFVMCSIQNTSAVLREIHRVLKPGGIFVFMDHAAENDSTIRRFFQQLIEPILGDCKFKDIEEIMRSGPFDQLFLRKYSKLDGLIFNGINPVVFGYGLKSV